ncbi:MAG: hypothetical protein RH916_06305, partial [Vicingaceae bacterium]
MNRIQFRKALLLVGAGLLSFSLSHAQMAAGNYTINSGNPTSGSNFNSFGDFISALSTAGNAIQGAVNVTVASGSGPYNETVTFPS